MPDPLSPSLLIPALLGLADIEAHDGDTVGLLRQLTDHSLRLPGIEAVGVLLDVSEQGQEVIASDEVADRLEHLQVEYGEGPCRDAWRSGRLLADLPLPHPHCRARWPHFTPCALAEGFTAITALPLRYRDRTFGALNLFHQHRSVGPAGIRACQALADAAALGLAHQQTLRGLREYISRLEGTLGNRVVIEQAKGVLTERLNLAPEDAFDRMRRHARAHRRRLADLALQIIYEPAETGPFPRPDDHRECRPPDP